MFFLKRRALKSFFLTVSNMLKTKYVIYYVQLMCKYTVPMKTKTNNL